MTARRIQERTTIQENLNYRGDYYHITFQAPEIAPHVRPGQFAHVLLPDTKGILLRRPFSIYNADPDAGTISIIYKNVGIGTDLLSRLSADDEIDIIGPLGNGFPDPIPGRKLMIVAGGYGCAATYLLARNFDNPCICMLGGRSAGDILVEDKFEEAGATVRISTDDGSEGHKGLVTELLIDELSGHEGEAPLVYACGPNPMLRAVADICLPQGIEAFLSLDQHMCCGVGACFACVVKIKADNDDGWEYIRSCKEGPVFRATEIYWE